MKYILIILLFFQFELVYSQSSTDRLLIGTSINSDATSNIFAQFESQSEWVKIQMSYLTNFEFSENRFNVKFGIRPIFFKKHQIEFWTFMPYLNMNMNERFKYNTPFSFEMNWLPKNLSIVADISKTSQVQIRYRLEIFSKKVWLMKK